jgi:peptidoglycan/LPS O-acetylase OafA/YrhL
MNAVLTFTCFDAFGLGALLAWVITYSPEKLKKFYSVISVIAAVSVFFFVVGIIQKKWTIIPLRTISSFMALWLITYIILRTQTNTLKFKLILNNKILIFLGKISYGLYLYHNLIPTLNAKIIDKYINPLLPDILYKRYTEKILLLENTILLIVISWLSYILIEKWFLNLKEKFGYQVEYNKQRSIAAGGTGH